ncbi:hypothetical protein P872_04525 [Rhodonellum psychrophilum GCM71 = DSM 17998]|uniref:Uncharacterized protein n=1 Tax=Rhodonellum psychrophilum GCM71 = DSM 17998 TaxID=1123057 RepID=U5C313_9BACT|nr:hypothetical protein P872_04525 [Rhodonellum psychrophilum GCM71 = DSM 17998]
MIRYPDCFYFLESKVKGSISRDLIKSNDKSTANPKSLKGIKISQTNGYRTNAMMAMGQHKIKRINQRRKLVITRHVFRLNLQFLFQ